MSSTEQNVNAARRLAAALQSQLGKVKSGVVNDAKKRRKKATKAAAPKKRKKRRTAKK